MQRREQPMQMRGMPGAVLALWLSGWTVGGASAQDREPDREPVSTDTGVVLGEVVSAESGEPVGAAAVELLLAGDSSLVATTTTGAQGRFRIGQLPAGTFLLRLSTLGYGTAHTEAFELAEAETRNLGVLPLSVDAVAVEPIVVSAERTVVTFEADRTAYNVGVMTGTEGASVTETLATIPELEVDVDGQVTLRGEAVAIYIDGRPAPMSGDALIALLEQFPAEYLQKIEILDNPSARYRSEGSGGIVNLVTKQGVELGLSGTIFANAGTRGDYGTGARGTLQRGRWTVDGGGFVRLSESSTTGYDLRQNLRADPAFLRQDTRSDRSSLSGNVDLDVRYDLTERARLHAEGRVSRWERESIGLTETRHMDDVEETILEYDRMRRSRSDNVSFDVSTGLEYQWQPRVHTLELELEVERGTQRGDGRDEISADVAFADDPAVPAELILEDEEERELEVSLDVDYARPWGEDGRIELGYVAELGDTDDDRILRAVTEPESAPEGVVTQRGFDQREVSNSVYGTAQRSFGDLSVQLGLRAEHLGMSFTLPNGDSFDRTYTNLFPSANLSYQLDRARRLRLSYSRRIRRPRSAMLNPTDVSTDPLNRRVGNPDLEPQFTHSVTLHAYWSGTAGSLRLSPYYRRTTNDWGRIMTVDDDGVSTRTYANVASAQGYGASLTYSVPQRNGWRGNISISARREDRDASNLGAGYSGGSLLFSSRANVTGRITDALSAQVNLGYSPPSDLLQGRRDARYRADLGVRYQFLDDRGSIRLSLRDPFELRRSGSRTRDQDYIQIDRSRESIRSARISVSYSLGGGGQMRPQGRRGRRP